MSGVIADSSMQLNASPASEVLFSKHRLETTLASGYFEMLGVLTKSPEGVRYVFVAARRQSC